MTDTFLSHLVEKNRDLFTPPLPESFIPRSDPLNCLKSLLTDSSGEQTIVMTSRDGVGGMGKTSLALALMEDETIQSAFPDGILWATLGQDPDLLTPLARWLSLLNEQGLSLSTIAMASEQLRHLIKRRRMLLIVDEVYALEDLEPFQVISDTSCRLLVTSRDVVVPEAQSYELQEMTVAQSQQFFETQLKQSLEQRNKKDALHFAKSVGCLPLSLNLGVLQVKTGVNWGDLLTGVTLENHLETAPNNADGQKARGNRMGFSFANLPSLWNTGQTREVQHQTRQKCLKFCLERLSIELRLRFASLGLFPRDVAITPQMSGMMWGLSIPESHQRLLLLKQQGFLTPGEMNAKQGQSYHLHPVMRDMARWLISVPQDSPMPGLGLTWSGAHQQFLERYRPLLQDGQWHTVPNDDYIHAHLLWHLEQAGWLGEIHQLLQAFSPDARNAWYDVCDRLGLRDNFTIDLARAWQLAKDLYQEAPEHSIGLQVRYGLTASFVRQSSSVAFDQTPAHAQTVSKVQTPSPERILEDWAFTKTLLQAARYLPDLATKVIKSTLCPSTLTQAAKEQTIVELLRNVSQDSSDAALELTEHLLPKVESVDALVRLAPERPIFCYPLLRLLQQTHDNSRLVAGVACLAQIGDHKFYPEIYALLPKIEQPLDRLLILEQLYERLPTLLQPKAEAFKQSCLQALRSQSQGLGQLPLTYGPALKAVDVATEEFLDLYDHSGWAIALCFEEHPSAELATAYSQAMQSRSEEKRSKTLGFLLPNLSPEHQQNVWKICEQFTDPECKARILSRILPFQSEALDPLLMILKLFEHHKKLDILLQCLPAPDRLIREMFKTMFALSHPNERWAYLEKMLPHLQPDLFPEFVEVIQDTPFHANGVQTILQKLKPEQSAIATGIIEMVDAIPPVYERAIALQQVSPFLPEEHQAKALTIAQAIQFPYARVIALQTLIPNSPEVAQDAIQALTNCHAESPDDLYESLIPVLPLQERTEAIALIATLPEDESKLKRLIRILPYQADLIEDIKSLVQANPELRSHCELAPVLDELHRICEADLLEANPNPPQTIGLILAMLPLIDWIYSPEASASVETADNRFCEIIQRFLEREDLPHGVRTTPHTISQLFDFFFFIPVEEKRAQVLEMLIQSTLTTQDVTPEDWMGWLEKLSRYRPYEFHWILSSMLPLLMSFSNSNTLNQTLQSIRTVREQWNQS